MMLKAFDAITVCRFARHDASFLRQEDSSAQSMLPAATESADVGAMPNTPALPTDIAALHALIAAERAAHSAIAIERDIVMRERDLLAARTNRLESLNSRLAAILAEMKRARFGRKSERLSEDQLALALEDLEIAAAKVEAEGEKADPQLKREGTRKRRASRNENLDHLPHEETVIEPEGGTTCACCKGELHKIGEDRTKRLDKQPAKLRVIVEVRPKYGCRTCEKTGADNVAGVVQAPAPAHLIEGGLPTEALVADVIVSKHADHQPLYRQSQIMARVVAKHASGMTT